MPKKLSAEVPGSLDYFLQGKSATALQFFDHFIQEYRKIGEIELHPLKSMIAVGSPRGRAAYITQLGRNFIHVVFPFDRPYPDNLCFQKVAQVPGDSSQFNHHFRMLAKDDVNDEVRKFMRLAYGRGANP